MTDAAPNALLYAYYTVRLWWVELQLFLLKKLSG